MAIMKSGALINCFLRSPLTKPMSPQDINCQMAQIPIPRSILERKVTNIVRIIAEAGPSIKPHIMISAVTG
ncbi:iron only hydrogenase large subunit, C-terminal domain containing protein [Oceanobacillus picturae]|uniref:Iron only hydrogenase large subunit, C-terminal domain containing protein n=1 Tax=Oceanobacillus picturae TaxID=171693 RepID=A0A0U9H544_9BACI|nr:iron only hydrogenase large subunit, C-terminal domain containing protein [Oceanobacillus picturae]